MPSTRPSTRIDDVELATLTWVAWYKSHRLLEPLGYVPPAVFKQAFSAHQQDVARQAVLATPAPHPDRYFAYYHQARTHRALDKDTHDLRRVELPTAGGGSRSRRPAPPFTSAGPRRPPAGSRGI